MICLFFERSLQLRQQLLNSSSSLLEFRNVLNQSAGCIRVEHPPFRSGRLLVEIRVVMMVPMMVMVVCDHHNLYLRRIGQCKTGKGNKTDLELVHDPL